MDEVRNCGFASCALSLPPNKPLTWPTTLFLADLRSLFLDAGLARRSLARLAFWAAAILLLTESLMPLLLSPTTMPQMTVRRPFSEFDLRNQVQVSAVGNFPSRRS